MRLFCLVALFCLVPPSLAWAGTAAGEKKPKPPKPPKVHTVVLGAGKRVPYSKQGDPAGAVDGDKELRVRPLVVDGKVKEWTAGESHDVTDRSFVIRRAIRLNDALPTDKVEHWVWQRGPWLLVDRTAGHLVALHLPDYDPSVSDVSWFRDYAAYCGLHSGGRQLYAVVAQVAGRKPLVAKKLGTWDPENRPSPACAPAAWQREPLRISFQPTGGAPASFDLVGLSAVLVEDGDSGDEAKPE
ncbi:MAG TPA: hypothetical protein VGD62_08955 [Acidobacteriaceae bacterium]